MIRGLTAVFGLRLVGSRQDVQYQIAADGFGQERLFAGLLNGVDPVARDDRKNADELPIAIGKPTQALLCSLQCLRQLPVSKRRSVAQCARLLLEHVEVVPRRIDGSVPAILAAVQADQLAVVVKGDAIRIGADRDDFTGAGRFDAVAVAIEADQRGRRHPGGALLIGVKGDRSLHQRFPFLLGNLSHCLPW